MVAALKAFARKADAADLAIVYYAGHGIEIGGTNYLIPIDAKLETDRDVPLDRVLQSSGAVVAHGRNSAPDSSRPWPAALINRWVPG